jgi:Holliday junction resolvasome RuvABC endonuclease subunit
LNDKRIAGIDYSMSSPAIAIEALNKFHFFFMVDSEKKMPNKMRFDRFVLHPVLKRKEFKSNAHRFDWISDWAIRILNANSIEKVFLEGYSFGSSGSRVFDIGENTGVLKNKIMKMGIELDTVAPTVVKKFATGKGNAKKDRMEEVFIADSGLDLRSYLHQTNKQLSPSSDIIDSYFILKYGLEITKLSKGDLGLIA